MNKQQLANKIWESANKMRSKIEANEYKDYILGFIFYKFLSDKEVKYCLSLGIEIDELPEALIEEDDETRVSIQKNLGYFIAYKDLFSTWLSMGKDFDVSNVRDALNAFERLINLGHKKVFEGVFETLNTGLSKLGDSSGSQTKAISDLIHLIKDIPMDGKQDYDVLGFIYEYLISMFAANAGKKAGEFYTPHEVSELMSEIVAYHLKDRPNIQIYDPTSGSGSLLINIGRCVAKHMNNADNIKYYAQELKQNTYNLTRMNLVMRGILPDNIVTRNGDTLENDWPYFDENDPERTYNPLYVDAVVSNPPYSQNWDPTGKDSDPRYSRFGLAPKSKADYAFLLHDLYHLKSDGIMTIVLPHGVLFRGGEEGEIRKNLIEYNNIDAIIGLPANIFFGTGIPTIIMVLKQQRDNTDVLIIDASKGFVKEGKNNKLQASHIKKIVDTIIARADIPKFSRKVSRDEIRANEYNLNIPRYVDSSEATEKWDIYASMFGGIPMNELDELSDYWSALPGLQDALFSAENGEYAALGTDNVKDTIYAHQSVQNFINGFDQAFSDFSEYLRTELIENTVSISVSGEESVLSDDIFRRLSPIPLVDRYEAYQILDDNWTKTAIDLEIIQTEGFDAVKKVDPNMVIKKKNGRDEEVQNGWIGHVIPFELVQKIMLKSELDEIKSLEDRLSQIASELDEILDSISEEDKSSETVNDAGDAFVASAVAKEAKKIAAEIRRGARYDEDAFETKLICADKLFSEEKTLKSSKKTKSEELHLKTKATIEALADDEAKVLLEQKWIVPLTESITCLSDKILSALVDKVNALAKKYDVTFADVEKEIKETENILCEMIDKLCGSEFDMLGLVELKKLLGGE